MFMFFKGGDIVDRVTRYVMPTEDRALAKVKPLSVREMKMTFTEAWIPPVDVEPVRWDVAKKKEGQPNCLPEDVLLNIFSYLETGSDVVQCARVCRDWRAAVLSSRELCLIRAFTYYNAVGLNFLSEPFLSRHWRRAGEGCQVANDLIGALAKRNVSYARCRALEHEIVRNSEISVDMIVRKGSFLSSMPRLIAQLCDALFFDIASPLIDSVKDRLAPLGRYDRNIAEVCYRGAMCAFRLDRTQEYVKLLPHFLDHKNAEWECATAEVRQAKEADRLSWEIENAVKVNLWQSLVKIYQTAIDPATKVKAALAFVTYQIENEKDCSASEAIFVDALNVVLLIESERELYLYLECLDKLRYLSLDSWIEPILSRLEALSAAGGKPKSSVAFRIWLEALLIVGTIDKFDSLVKQHMYDKQLACALLAKRGYVDMAVEAALGQVARTSKLEALVAIAEMIVNREPTTAVRLIEEEVIGVLGVKSKYNLIFQEGVIALLRGAILIQKHSEEAFFVYYMKEIRNLIKIVDWRTTSSRMSGLGHIGQYFVMLGYYVEARAYFEEAYSCMNTKRSVNRPSVFTEIKLADQMAECGMADHARSIYTSAYRRAEGTGNKPLMEELVINLGLVDSQVNLKK